MAKSHVKSNSKIFYIYLTKQLIKNILVNIDNKRGNMSNFIGKYLSNCAKYNGEGVFLVYGDRRISWSELNDRVNRLANALIDLGVKKGDKVTIMFHNCPEFFESNYAIQKIGGIPVPMNYRFSEREIEYQTNHSDSTVIIFEDLWFDSVNAARPNFEKVKHLIYAGKNCPEDMLDYGDLINKSSPKEPDIEVKEDDICVICYTGGTTGMPKGVMLTYKNHVKLLETMLTSLIPRLPEIGISKEARSKIGSLLPIPGIARLIGLIETRPVSFLLNRPITQKLVGGLTKRMLGSPILIRLGKRFDAKVMMPSFPLFHDAAYQLVILTPIAGILTFVSPVNPSFDPEEVLKLIEEERPIMLGNVPTGWKKLLDFSKIDKYYKGSVLIAATGAGVNPGELKKKILKHFPGIFIVDVFGQTEMTPNTTIRIDTDSEKIKDRSVGKPIVQTRIIDEKGNDVKPGEIGEIIYNSPTIMKGYYKEPEKTAEVIKDGWFYSGDLGYFDEDGEIRVVERKKECISSGGEKIFPHEVEEILLTHPKVKAVCVIGVKDETWGSTVRAIIQLKEGEVTDEKEIIDWCRGNMAGYKKPKSVSFVDSFPVTPVGKIQRAKVKEMYGNP